MNTILNKISEIIEHYESGSFNSLENLQTMLRELSSNYYYLTKINIESYNEWTSIIYNREDKESVASAKVKADYKVKELRMTRKILEATQHVIWSIRQEISIYKNDK